MKLYLINPSNPLVSMVHVRESRWHPGIRGLSGVRLAVCGVASGETSDVGGRRPPDIPGTVLALIRTGGPQGVEEDTWHGCGATDAGA